MSDLLAGEADFVECMARKTMIYGLGRAVTIGDLPYLDEIVADFDAADHHFKDLVISLVTSDIFRMRRGEPD